MIVQLMMVLLIIGTTITLLPNLLEVVAGGIVLNPMLSFLFTVMGIFTLIAPSLIFIILAVRSTAIHLIDLPKRGQVLWLYILRGGYGMFVPSVRMAQAHLWSKGRGIVKDIGGGSRLSIGRHDCRIVLETVGHSVDPKYAQYASYLKRKYGATNLKQIRHFARFVDKNLTSEKQLEELAKKSGHVYEDPKTISDEEANGLFDFYVPKISERGEE